MRLDQRRVSPSRGQHDGLIKLIVALDGSSDHPCKPEETRVATWLLAGLATTCDVLVLKRAAASVSALSVMISAKITRSVPSIITASGNPLNSGWA